MSARQNKKQRKGRNNANNRERTVTMLTGDPDEPPFAPTLSEESNMPRIIAPGPFGGGGGGNKTPNVTLGAQSYQMAAGYNTYGYNGGTFGSNIHQQQPQHSYYPGQTPTTMAMASLQPQPSLPPGKNDLEILQNLKKIILSNQHPFFKAVPQPAVLAALYKGPLTSSSSQPSVEAQAVEQTTPGVPQASVDNTTVPQAGSALSETPPSDPNRKQDVHDENLPGKDNQQPPTIDESEILSAGGHTGSNQVMATPTFEKPALHPPTASGSRSAEPPASENPVHDKYDPRTPLWDAVKTEPSDDPMNGQTTLYDAFGNRVPSPDFSRLPSPDSHPPGVISSETANRPPGENDRGSNSFRGSWNDRNRRQSFNDRQNQPPSRRQSSNSSGFQFDSPSGRRGPGDDFGARRPSADARRLNGTSVGRMSSLTDVPSSDTRPISRVPLISRIETDEAAAAASNSSTSTPMEPPPLPIPVVGSTNVSDPSPSQDRVGAGEGQPQRNYQHHNKKRFNRNQQGGGPNQAPGPPSGGGQRYEPSQRQGYTRPSSPPPPPHSGNSFPRRSPSTDGRGPRVPPSPSRGGRDYRGPPPRAVSQDRGASSYRPDYDADLAPRYPDNRPPYGGRDYSPPPGDRNRSGHYSPPPPGSASGRDWTFGNYPPNRRDYPAEYDSYKPRNNWDNAPPGDRERYQRDYPPRPAGWVDRGEREYPPRDSYPSGPPPAHDERYTDRTRPPPQSGFPTYNNRRQRSASPPRRSGSGVIDDRPPVKRAREDYLPGDFYTPLPPAGGGGRDGGRRPNDYPPPRAGSPGPPSGSGTSWPPPSSASSTGPPGGPPPDRDYRMGGGYGPPPGSGAYDRPRSPGPPGRGNYNRGGGYNSGGRGGYAPRT